MEKNYIDRLDIGAEVGENLDTLAETERFKYVADVHRKYGEDFEPICRVRANTIEGLKKAARSQARHWNKHGSRLYLTCTETGREWVINS